MLLKTSLSALMKAINLMMVIPNRKLLLTVPETKMLQFVSCHQYS